MSAIDAALECLQRRLTQINNGLQKKHEFRKPILIHEKPKVYITSCKKCGLQLREIVKYD
jgi:hypothetical protein